MNVVQSVRVSLCWLLVASFPLLSYATFCLYIIFTCSRIISTYFTSSPKKSLSFSLIFFLRINTGICSLWNFHDYSALSCSNFYRSQDFDLAIFVFENWRFRSGMIYCLMNVQCPCNWSTPSRFSALHACQSKSLLTTCRAHTHDWQRWGARSLIGSSFEARDDSKTRISKLSSGVKIQSDSM